MPAFAEGSITLTAVDDGLISASGGDFSIDNSVSGLLYFSGVNSRPLVKFDVSSIAANSVASATLTLYSINFETPPDPRPFNPSNIAMTVHRVIAPWTEGQVTWNNSSTGVLWATAGGDFVSSVAGTSTANPGFSRTPVTWDVTDLVKDWVNGVHLNHGLLIKSEAGNNMFFNSLENGQANPTLLYPTLTITAVPEPSSSMILGVLGASGVLGTGIRRRLFCNRSAQI